MESGTKDSRLYKVQTGQKTEKLNWQVKKCKEI